MPTVSVRCMRVAKAPKPWRTRIATISRNRPTSLMAVLNPLTLVTKLPTFAKTILFLGLDPVKQAF